MSFVKLTGGMNGYATASLTVEPNGPFCAHCMLREDEHDNGRCLYDTSTFTPGGAYRVTSDDGQTRLSDVDPRAIFDAREQARVDLELEEDRRALALIDAFEN